jgi:hypothetical protein
LILENGPDRGLVDAQHLQLVVRKSGLPQEVRDRLGAPGDVRGVLQQHHVAGHQGRRAEPKRLPEREIPRHDGQYGPEGLMGHVALLRRRLHRPVGQEIGAVLRVVAARPRTLLGFGPGLRKGLPHLFGHEGPEGRGVVFEEVGGLLQARGPLVERATSVRLEGRRGSVQASLDLPAGVHRISFDLLSRRGIYRDEGHGPREVMRQR